MSKFNLIWVELIIQVHLWINFLNRDLRNDVYGEPQMKKIESKFVFLKSWDKSNRKMDEQMFLVTANTDILSLAYKRLNI